MKYMIAHKTQTNSHDFSKSIKYVMLSICRQQPTLKSHLWVKLKYVSKKKGKIRAQSNVLVFSSKMGNIKTVKTGQRRDFMPRF